MGGYGAEDRCSGARAAGSARGRACAGAAEARGLVGRKPAPSRGVDRGPGRRRYLPDAGTSALRRIRVRYANPGRRGHRARPGRRLRRVDRVGVLDSGLDDVHVPRPGSGRGVLHPGRPGVRDAKPERARRTYGWRHRCQRQVGVRQRGAAQPLAGDHRGPGRRRGRADAGRRAGADIGPADHRRLVHVGHEGKRQRQHRGGEPVRPAGARAADRRDPAGYLRLAAERGRGDLPGAPAPGRLRIFAGLRPGHGEGREGSVLRAAARTQDHLYGLHQASPGTADPPAGRYGGQEDRRGRLPCPPRGDPG